MTIHIQLYHYSLTVKILNYIAIPIHPYGAVRWNHAYDYFWSVKIHIQLYYYYIKLHGVIIIH